MRRTSGFLADANRAGMMRLVIAVLLAVIAVDAATRGHYLLAAARLAFASVAALLAYGTLPGRDAPAPRLLGGLVGAACLLWAASFIFPAL
jgi:hypothetical protein